MLKNIKTKIKPYFTTTHALISSIMLFVFLLPWQARYIITEFSTEEAAFSGMSFYATDMVYLIMLACWMFWAHKQKKSVFQNLFSTPARRYGALISLLMSLFIVLSVIWAPDTSVAGYQALRFLQALGVILVIITSPVSFKQISLSIVLSATLQGIVAFQQFLLQSISASTFKGMSAQSPADLGVSVIEYEGERWLRSYGYFPHPNSLGGWLAIAMIFAITWYLDIYAQLTSWHGKFKKMKTKTRKFFRFNILAVLMSITFISVGLLLTFSRAAWLGVAIGLMSIGLTVILKTKKETQLYLTTALGKVVLIGLAIALVFNTLFAGLWVGRIKGESRVAQISVNQRDALISQSARVIEEVGVLGAGVGGYLPTLIEQLPNNPKHFYQPVHNIWLLFYAEFGLVGIGLFLVWVLLILSCLRQLLVKEFDLAHTITCSLLLMIGIMGYFDHYWWTLPSGLMMVSVCTALYLKTIIR